MAEDGGRDDEALRRDMAVAIRAVLEEGLRGAGDPLAYLLTTAEEIRQIVGMAGLAGGGGTADGAAARALLLAELEAAIEEMIRRLRH